MIKQFLAVSALISVLSAQGLPPRLNALKCKRSEPDKFDACFLNGLNVTWPEFMKGVPEINMPPLDPFQMDYLEINNALPPLGKFQLILKNLTDTGYGKAYNYDFHVNLKNYNGYIRTYIPSQQAETDYEINGNVLGFDFTNSKGSAVLDLTDIKVFFNVPLDKVKKNNVEYFQLGNPLYCNIHIKKGHIKLTEKDPSRQAQADNLAKFYNANSGVIMNVVAKGFTENEVVKQFRNKTNPILASVPADDWFLD